MRLLLVGLVLSFSGCTCGEPCDPAVDVPKCEDNVVISCPAPGVDQLVGANRWIRKDCAEKVCVLAGGSAFCALSSTPEGACDGGVSRGCESPTRQLACEQGFATYRFPCLSCEQTDAGSSCGGGPASRCTTSAQCAPELHCDARGYCYGGDAGG